MENEVNPKVLEVVERIRTSTPKRTVTEVIERAGVRDAKDKRSDYAWELPGGGHLLTVWTEFTHVHTANSRWFYVETLDTNTRRGGGARGPLQKRRAEFRLDCLRKMFAANQDCSAVLQINRLSIAELEANADAVVGVRVKDDERWHVAAWDEARNQVILVRGLKGWAPTSQEVDEHLAAGVFNLQSAPAPRPEPRIVFPDQAHRDLVEAAAIEHMTEFYVAQRHVVHDVSTENRGYDLEVVDAAGIPVQLVEVKGTSMIGESFFLSGNERKCAERVPAWRLAIVTNALTSPTESVYSAQEMENLFDFEPLVWKCGPKR
jgi:hypothetical protein